MHKTIYGNVFGPEMLVVRTAALEAVWAEFHSKGDVRTLNGPHQQFKLTLARFILEVSPDITSAEGLAKAALQAFKRPAARKLLQTADS
jgi:hypothetical protein